MSPHTEHYSLVGIALFSLLLHLPITVAGELQASSTNRQTTLIELYTSQGCSSCPPAERWLSQLEQDPRLWSELIPVAFHVDYWDYIGWQDKLANPAFAQRQRLYRKQGGLSSVYTPGFVVNGKEWRRWSGLRKLPQGHAETGRLTLTLKGDRISANFTPATELKDPLTLNVAILGLGISERISRGENAGETLRQDFVVLAHAQSQESDHRWEMPLPQYAPHNATRFAIAAWVSSGSNLAPLQATGGWLPPAHDLE